MLFDCTQCYCMGVPVYSIFYIQYFMAKRKEHARVDTVKHPTVDTEATVPKEQENYPTQIRIHAVHVHV